jgi:hydroxymethylbilane synthase
LNQALSEIGGKGLFTKELDIALLENEVDICVHSMKDVPTWIVEGTVLPCNLPREETNDVFISRKYKSIEELPDGALIGSASLRRQAQLMAINPTLKVVNFRGNVQTRLKKIENGDVEATLLALAGLKRLGMADEISGSEVLSWSRMLPAVAQGAIGIQCRSDDSAALRYISQLNHIPTKVAVDCERSFLMGLDGNCRTPIAGQAVVVDGKIRFEGFIAKPDGTDALRVHREGSADDAEAIGLDAATEIRSVAGSRFVEYQQAVEAAQTAARTTSGWAAGVKL